MEKKTDKYLLEDSAETRQIIQNLKNLLESNESANLKLAFQIMEAGGAPSILLTHLLAIKFWHRDNLIRQEAQKLLNRFATESLLQFVRQTWRQSFREEHQEVKINEQLLLLSQNPQIDAATLGLMSLKLRKRGGKFCLEQKVAPYLLVLGELVQHRELNLTHYELTFLPKEIGQFPDLLTLNISGNLFKNVPRELTNLVNLEQLYYYRTPLTKSAIRFLEKTFPKIFARKYYEQATELKSESQYLKAIKLYNKALKLDTAYEMAYLGLGASYIQVQQANKAQVVLKKALELLTKELNEFPKIAENWYLRACAYALLGEKEPFLADLKTAVALNPNLKLEAGIEEDFSTFFEDELFKSII
jgi:tetratricopeptide (TPR) repeat protein